MVQGHDDLDPVQVAIRSRSAVLKEKHTKNNMDAVLKAVSSGRMDNT